MMLIEYPKPQPVNSPTVHFTESHGPAALDHIPSAKIHIAETIAFHSAAESNTRILLLGQLSTEVATGNKMIARLKSDDCLPLLLELAISHSQRSDLENAVGTFLQARNKVKAIRDTFAHAVFATRSDLPGVILVSKADTYRKAHALAFEAIESGEIDLSSLFNFPFQAWSAEDFLRASRVAKCLLHASHALSVCFSRDPGEANHLREELERRGLLGVPPHEV